MRENGKNAMKNGAVEVRLSPASVEKKMLEGFNSAFVAAVNGGSAKVETKETTVKNPTAEKEGDKELKYSFPQITVSVANGSALAYFKNPILDKDGKETGEFGYLSADGKTKQTPEELLDELISNAITAKEKASIRQKTLNASIPDDEKALWSSARKLVAAGKFGGKKDEDIKSDANVAATKKAVAVLRAAADAA